jgi:hypothetical protein
VIAKDLLKFLSQLAIITNRKAHYEGFKELEVVCLWEHDTSSVLAFFMKPVKFEGVCLIVTHLREIVHET